MSSERPPGDGARCASAAALEVGGAVNGGANSLIGAAAADIACHGGIDLGIGGLGGLCEQRGRRHDLSRLAIAALGNVELEPRALYRVAVVGRETLDGGDALATRGAPVRHAGAHRRALEVHGAGTPKCHATAVFCAGEPHDVAQHPQQRHVLIDIEPGVPAVEVECDHRFPGPRSAAHAYYTAVPARRASARCAAAARAPPPRSLYNACRTRKPAKVVP